MSNTINISWYLGFGWVAIGAFIACGVAINLVDGWLRWALYVPFVLLGVHMSIRLRSFNTQRWRRVHSRAMIDYAKPAAEEYAAAKREARDFDVAVPCRTLAIALLGAAHGEALELLPDDQRKTYYSALLEAYPDVFTDGISVDRHAAVLEGARRDIAASQLGPDIVIAKAIEARHQRLEAARYLHALLLGRVR